MVDAKKTTEKPKRNAKTTEAATVNQLSAAGFNAAQIAALRKVFKAR